MKLTDKQYTYSSLRTIATAALVTTLALSTGSVFAVEKDAQQDRVELRIKDMHSKLKITSAQEEQWSKVAVTMRDNAKTMDTLTQSRDDHAKNMTAVDDLKSYGEIIDAHADGIKKLTPVFATLYASMSDTQKMKADTLFRHGEHEHHKHGHKMSNDK